MDVFSSGSGPFLGTGRFDPARLLSGRGGDAPAIRVPSPLAEGEERVVDGGTRTDRSLMLSAMEGRVRDAGGARRVQWLSHRLSERYAAYTPRNRRMALLDRAVTGAGGLKYVVLAGVVARFAGSGGRVGRIMLMSPTVAGPDDVGDVGSEVVDSHIWLMADDLSLAPVSGVADRGALEGAVHIGDVLYVDCALRAYSDKHGARRFGVGAWTPRACSLEYGVIGADGVIRRRFVPSHIRRSFRLFDVRVRPECEGLLRGMLVRGDDFAGHRLSGDLLECEWADPDALSAELARADDDYAPVTQSGAGAAAATGRGGSSRQNSFVA